MLLELVGGLTADERKLLHQRFVQGLTCGQIGYSSGIKGYTIDKKLRKIFEKLRIQLAEAGYEDGADT